jgi:heterodisulfide reductase subunit A-like polyferredoxin
MDSYLKKYADRYDKWLREDKIATTNETLCLECGLCSQSCPFNARVLKDKGLAFDPEHCYGCGVCIPACPEKAIEMRKRHERSML